MSAPGTQPVAGTWQQEFARQPFRQRLTWLQNLAAAALALTVSVNVLFGIINGRRLERIEHGHYPLMQTTRSLEVTLWRLQRELQDAVAAADTERFAPADDLSRTFAEELHGIETNATAGDAEVARLNGEFSAYYTLARATSAPLIAGGPSDALLPTQQLMQKQYNDLVQSLAAIRTRSSDAMDQAFSSARRLQATGWILTLVIAGVSILALRRLSQSMAKSLTASVVTALDGAEAEVKARTGDLAAAIHAALAGPAADGKAAPDRPLVTRHSVREAQRPLRVLLVEENVINRALIINLLKKRGHSVVIAENGREAIDAHARERFDVVLMDVQMPEVDGFEATAAIRGHEDASGLHLPIIALTAHAMTGDRERCLAAGMDFYLTKPVHPSELYQTLEAAVPRLSPPSSLSFDPAEALACVADDRSLLAQMVELFRAESPKMLAAIRTSVASGDGPALARSAHALTGAVGNFGPTESFHSARELERMDWEGVLAGASERHTMLEEQVGRLESDLATFVAKLDVTPGLPPDVHPPSAAVTYV